MSFFFSFPLPEPPLTLFGGPPPSLKTPQMCVKADSSCSGRLARHLSDSTVGVSLTYHPSLQHAYTLYNRSAVVSALSESPSTRQVCLTKHLVRCRSMSSCHFSANDNLLYVPKKQQKTGAKAAGETEIILKTTPTQSVNKHIRLNFVFCCLARSLWVTVTLTRVSSWLKVHKFEMSAWGRTPTCQEAARGYHDPGTWSWGEWAQSVYRLWDTILKNLSVLIIGYWWVRWWS